jgi:hypothetical protein
LTFISVPFVRANTTTQRISKPKSMDKWLKRINKPSSDLQSVRWFQDTAGSEITTLVATLPEDAVTAAREYGQARDLTTTVGELLTEMRAVNS